MCGCSINDESSSKSKEDLFEEQARKHLAQKYPELEYTLGDVQFGTMWDDPDDTIEVTIENGKFKGRTFQIRRKASDNPDKELTDKYFSYLISDDYEKFVANFAAKFFNTYKIMGYCSAYFENDYTSKNTFKDAMRSNKFFGDIYIYVKPTFSSVEEFQKIANKFLDDYKKEGLKTDISIYYLNPGIFEDLDSCDDSKLEEIINNNSYQVRIFKTVNEEKGD